MTGPAAIVLLPALMVAAPAPLPPASVVLDCYVVQSGRLGLGQFVRHVEVHPERGIVSIADGLRGGALRWLGNGRLLTLDADQLVFDFASSTSSGRTEIDRRSGAFVYRDGRSVIEGSCQASTL